MAVVSEPRAAATGGLLRALIRPTPGRLVLSSGLYDPVATARGYDTTPHWGSGLC